MKLGRKEGELVDVEAKYQNKRAILREKERVLDKMKNQILKLMEKKREKVDKWKKKLENTHFYERDTETDRIMTQTSKFSTRTLCFLQKKSSLREK